MSYPLFIVIVFGFFFMPYTRGYIKEVLAFSFLTAIVIGLNIFIAKEKFRKEVVIFMLSLLSVFAFIKLSFYINYKTKISASALYVIFETNKSEAFDFLYNYFNISVFAILILLLLFFLFSITYLLKDQNLNFDNAAVYKISACLIIIVSAFCIHWKLSRENIILMSFVSYNDYLDTKNNLRKNLAQPRNDNITGALSLEIPQTYVVIIGESTSRWHMQLYGYDRETNPKLSEIKGELIVFEDVITSNVHTILALDKILTLSDFNYPDKEKNASIVQLANQAGFETFWISNQRPVGFHESIPTIIGSAAKNKRFLNTDNHDYDIYDDKLLPEIEKALNKKGNKKILFIHMIGSHSRYMRRYPKSLNYFKSNKTHAKYTHEKALKMINEYDNAIRFNDYVVREIIEKVRMVNTNSYVLYFSDHGDEVYDTMDLVGHSEYHATKPMYDVPFIGWFSNEYRKLNPELFENSELSKRPYILEDFIHSFGDISRIEFDGINYEKSIFSNDFKVKKRIIKNNENYDTKK